MTVKNEDKEWLRNSLEQIMRQNGWSCESWARKAGISPTTLTRFINKQTNHVPSTSTLLKLEQAAGKPLLGTTLQSEFMDTNAAHKERLLKAGNYMKKIREEAGFTQRQLATKLRFNHYGIISQIETGATILSSQYWKELCEITGSDIIELTHILTNAYYPEIYEVLMLQHDLKKGKPEKCA